MLGLIMVISMFSVVAINAAEESDPQVLRRYDYASAGDILFYADFNSEAYKSNSVAQTAAVYTPSADGRELNIAGLPGQDQKENYFGAYFADLEVNKGSEVTMIFQIKSFGAAGKNNSVGIGCWFIDNYSDGDLGWKFINEYGNWTSAYPITETDAPNRSAIGCGAHKTQEYTNGIDEATPDADGFITVKIEYKYGNSAAERTVTTYYVKDGAFVKNNTASFDIKDVTNKANIPDHLGIGIYNHYEVVNTSIKNVKIFKGLDLSLEQLSITENTTPEVEPTTTTKRELPAPVTKAPATEAPAATTTAAPADEGGCGSTIALSALAIVPMIGAAVVLGKKKED